MYLAPPADYDAVMRRVPVRPADNGGGYPRVFCPGKRGGFYDPITAGIFVSIAAWASHQRKGRDETPWWRTLKANGELNPKYPGGVQAQRERLEAEGHTVAARGRKNIRYFVEGYEAFLCVWPDSFLTADA